MSIHWHRKKVWIYRSCNNGMSNEMITQFRWILIEQTSGIYISQILLIIAVSALLVLVPGYVLYRTGHLAYSRVIHIYLTVVYLGIILLFTVFRRTAGSKSGAIETNLNLGFNKNSIYSVRQMVYSFLNIMLFVPWGILIGIFREKDTLIKGVFMAGLVGFITSFSIELIQHITKTGVFQITDIITNICGTFFGAFVSIGIVVVVRRVRNNVFRQE